jgi:hypothetical protein
MIDYDQLEHAWNEWARDLRNCQLVVRQAPDLVHFDPMVDYCGPRCPVPGRVAVFAVSVINLLVPDYLFGIHIGFAGFWHDRLYLMGGDRMSRLWADCLFIAIIWDQIYRSSGSPAQKYCAYLTAWWYFLALRAFGWLLFRFKPKGERQ